MNRLCGACMVTIALLNGLSGYTQTSISPYFLSVSFQKTTNIIFPYRIQKADIGSADVIGHKDPILPNVLFLKANRKGFATTNLSVYTSDGKFYSFIVHYQEVPDTLNLSFANQTSTNHTSANQIIIDTANDARLDSDAVIIRNAKPVVYRKTSSQQMKLILKGIYIKDHLMWFRLEIRNHSEVEYQPEYVRFFANERHTGKRTAAQENEQTPVWQSANDPISGKENKTILYAFPAFTLEKHKKLVIQISENNGGRILNLDIPAKTLLKGQSI